MRQACADHGKYKAGCDDCKAAMRAYCAARKPPPTTQRIYDLPVYVEGDTRWMADAACRHVDIDFFGGYGSGNHNTVVWAQAKKVCATCPVAGDCLQYAIRTDQPFGVWGGLTAGERRDLQRRMAS
jgi:WhiB family redox-sensing transcriptional regulator